MGKKDHSEPRVYVIPKNFLDSGYVFGGRIKQRNFIEAALLTAPVLGVFIYGWKVAGWSVTNTAAICIILCSAIFLAAATGVAGDSLLEFLRRVQHFRQHKRISKYNPRVKLEHRPDFLTAERQSLPREKLLGLVKGLEEKILGDDGLPVSADITDDHLIVYFRGDEGFVEKPEPLKTPGELRAEAKAASRREKQRKKQEKEYVRSLPRSQRKAARKSLRLAAKTRAAQEKQRQNAERLRNEARVQAALAAAQQRKSAEMLPMTEPSQNVKPQNRIFRRREKGGKAHAQR